jgi:hypothetical protein
MMNVRMDQIGSPKSRWLMYMMYVVLVLNLLAHPKLDMCTPIESVVGYKPDSLALLCIFLAPISMLFCAFSWHQPAFYLNNRG